jgi:hypothetical protein
LTSGFAALRQVADRTRDFLTAWNDHSSRLPNWLDRDFLRRPHDLDRSGALAREGGETLVLVEIVDAVRIGAIETVELLLDWRMRDHDGREFTIERWPFVIQWLLEGGQPRVLRLQPRTLTDQGRYEAEGYVHDALRVRLDAVPDTVLSRTQTELCELQISLRRGGLAAQVLGLFAGDNEAAARIHFRLTGGAATLRRGKCIATASDGGARVQDWEFELGDAVARERWTFLQHGRRYLLLRCVATGRDAATAAAAFAGADAQAWFAAVRQALRIG